MKNLKNLGQALTKAEQKMINGGIVSAIDKCGTLCEIGSTGCKLCTTDLSYRRHIIPPNG